MNEQAITGTLQAAYASLQRGDLAGADRALTPLERQYPARPDVLHLRALVARAGGDLAGARGALARAVEANQGSAELRNSLGNVLIDMGLLDEAEAQFVAALAADPVYLSAWINRGRLASRKGEHDRAVELLEHACALAPRSALACGALADAQREAGNPDQAVAAMRKAVAIDPAGTSSRLRLGIALRAAERQREAIAEYDEAERAGCRLPELLDNRGAAWLDLGDVEAARRDYDALVARFPTYLAGHRARARLYWECGLEGDPFASYRALADANPREPLVWNEWLTTLLSFRRFDAVLEVAERAQHMVGTGPVVDAARSVALSETGQLQAADAAFAAGMAASGGQPAYLNAFVRHRMKSGDPAGAAAMAERAIALDPDNQLSWACLGTAWRAMGDPRETWLHDYDAHVGVIEAVPPDGAQGAEDFADAVAPALRALHRTKVHPGDQSLRNGTQTLGALFDRREPAIRRIRETVEAAALRFIAGLPDDPAHPLLRRKADAVRFAGSWSVRLDRNGFHINHVHERGWLSSAYYFALPPASEADPQAGWLQLGAPPEELGLALEPRRMVEPRVGTLVLFPSSMWHGTIPFASEGERLTAAFDIVPDARS